MREDKIDLVYLWVDGNDPQWLKKKEQYLDNSIKHTALAGRYENNDELKYSLRSVEKYLPWVRKIFIVTDNQVPEFLDIENPKITIVHHSEIIPLELLPTFNPWVLENFIHNIPNLSEKFIYANDDFFVNTDLQPNFFFKDGLPIFRMKSSHGFITELKLKKFFRRFLNTYDLGTLSILQLIKKKYGKRLYLRKHHNIDAYLKSDYKKATEAVFNEIKHTLHNRFRKDNDFHRMLFDCYILIKERGHLQYSTKNDSCVISLEETDYQQVLNYYQPKLFCLNDTSQATEEDRKKVQPFLDTLFPNKSQFEK